MSAVLCVALLFTTPVAPGPHGAGSEATSTTSTVTSPRPMFFQEFLSWPTSPVNVSVAVSSPPTSTSTTTTSVAATVSVVTTEWQSAPTEPAPTVPATKTDAELVDEIFGWPGRQLVTCESAWNRFAVGPQGERGLMQVHPVHARPGGIIERLGYTFDDMFEVVPNLRVAVEIRRQQGLRAWACWAGAA